MKSWVLFLAMMFWLAVRLVYNGARQLVPDEAYYWIWSRHLSMGYLDHPPMVAWLISLSTYLFGDNEFGVRAGAGFLTLGSILLVTALVRRICPNKSAAGTAVWILLLSPMTAALGMIVTPDTPACFFGMAALYCAVRAIESPGWWIGFGICAGAALDSKYTAVLLPASVGLALLSSSAGRRRLASVWPWLGIVVAALVFWPVVRWNQQHNWASFRFQFSHGTSEDASSPLVNLGSYWGGQLGLYSPVLFVLGVIAVGGAWRKYRQLTIAEQMVVIAATFPLIFFCAFAIRHRPEANWPVFAYWPMTVLLVRSVPSVKWLRTGVVVAAGMTLVAHIPEIIQLIPSRTMTVIPNPWEEMFGWREYGAELDRLSRGSTVYCTTYENAAEASFYMAEHQEVWTIDTNRPTAYDFFGGRPAEQSLERAVCVTRAGVSGEIPEALKGFPIAEIESWETTALHRVVRRRRFIILDRRTMP